MKDNDCTRAILVGHNAYFDLNFLNAAIARTEIKRNPFHPFSSFDTATLAGVAFGQTVLVKGATGCGDFVGLERSPLGRLRRSANSRIVLRDLQSDAAT